MTAKKEAYSGPLLASDMSAVRRGRGRAGRCEHRAVRSEQSGGWESDPGRQPLRSKYQHRRTKWRPWPRHMTRAPPLRAIPLSAGRGRHGPGTPPSGPLTAHALCCRLAGLDPCAPPHLGLLRCAVGRRRPLEPRAVGPVRSPGRGGAVARHISIWGGARGVPPPLRLRGTLRCSLPSVVSVCVLSVQAGRGVLTAQSAGTQYYRLPRTSSYFLG